MKGLILAGGAGTRLRPLTYTGAKQLVPIANRPVLFYVIDNLVDAGIVDIGVIISPETGAEVRAAIGDGGSFGARVTYLLQDKPLGLAHAVVVARDFLGDDSFVMYLGDNLIGVMIKDTVNQFVQSPDLSASVLLKEVSNPSSFGVAEIDHEGNVISLVEKPKEPKSNLALVGIYLFRDIVHQAISEIKPSARGELEITDAISRILQLGGKVSFSRVQSWWLDTGKKDDILLANDTVLDDWLRPGVDGEVDESSVLTGRVRVCKGARIVRSRVRGPVIIGEGSSIVDARIGPFTSIGCGVTIHRCSVDHSVIMDGSTVQDIPRLEDSLVGRRVVVKPGELRHGSLALLVGDDCVVELSRERSG
ncbi:MAG: glucose-1-phosphate thymidylyltransferase [Polyangiaceae bacterium]|nr:glucose-1-phosphate thymidylyltransferase [Polyangiaceae bacterium]